MKQNRRGAQCAPWNKNNAGISLIALIITIIVIIILAAIVLFTGLNAPNSANFAKFTQDVDNVNLAVTNKYARLLEKHSIADETRTQEQIYLEIATGEDQGIDKYMCTVGTSFKASQEESTGLQNITENGAKDVDHSIAMTLPLVRESRSAWYVTREGTVFNANGYEYDGKTYFTGAIYQNSVLPSDSSANAVRAKKIYEAIHAGKTEVTDVPETNTYTVTFNSNGGSEVASITGLSDGATISKPADPTLEGKEFAGWYKEAGLTNSFDFTNDTIHDSITLYAKWNTPIELGKEVTYKNEQFFVIAKDTTNGTVDLLTKYCLNADGTAQVDSSVASGSSGYGVAFCTGTYPQGGYWKDVATDNYEQLGGNNYYDLDQAEAVAVENGRATVMQRVRAYGTAKGASARLMNYEQAYGIQNGTNTTLKNILWGRNYTTDAPTQGYLYWWLGSAYDTTGVWFVYGSSSYLSNNIFTTANRGVRPVLTVSASDVS